MATHRTRPGPTRVGISRLILGFSGQFECAGASRTKQWRPKKRTDGWWRGWTAFWALTAAQVPQGWGTVRARARQASWPSPGWFFSTCAWFSGQFVSENTAKTTGGCQKKRTGGGNLGYFENIRIFGFFPAARITPPDLYGSEALVGASHVSLAEDIHDSTSKNMKFMENQPELTGNDTV